MQTLSMNEIELVSGGAKDWNYVPAMVFGAEGFVLGGAVGFAAAGAVSLCVSGTVTMAAGAFALGVGLASGAGFGCVGYYYEAIGHAFS
ncbi:hypothetical protein [uncultured Shewanella sp.]|uniref:hypothetical protein n=1 Tax=uncultured Shewanella sp. TaxID=173975 RepID=UPI00261CDBDE|nr:hypothetical protein [uncultured Shewanella sp.]